MYAFTETRKKEYLLPDKIVLKSDNVENAELLLQNGLQQNMIGRNGVCKICGKGFLVLDFGKEYFGGVRIMTNGGRYDGLKENIRIRFGESLTECMSELGEKNTTNDHSTRDFRVYMSHNADMEWGSTGYRYIRVDFIEDGVFEIGNIFGTFLHADEPKGKFSCNDERVNGIWEICSRTLFLNMQNGCIWDGAKRDQHIWVGDLYPEILTALYLYGDCEEIKNSLDRPLDAYPLPCWYNTIPTYNAWFMLIVDMYFKKTGKTNERYAQAVRGNIEQFAASVTESGTFNFRLAGLNYWETLFDWPSFGSSDSDYGCACLVLYALQSVSDSPYFDTETKNAAKRLVSRLNGISSKTVEFKAIEAFSALCGKRNGADAVAFLNDGGAKGYSAFLSYFISKALADNGALKAAFDNLVTYYGGMLDMGATTVWETFDLDWMENACKITEFPKYGQKDIHGDFGANCYVGFRHSLCHGWSCGFIPFVVEYVVGFSFADDTHKTVRFTPNLCGLKWLECEIPTENGPIFVRHEEKDGEVTTKVRLPDGVTLAS